jgi:hypothetical protein
MAPKPGEESNQLKLAEELERMRHEPLLPIEKKLVLWSVLLGLILLVALTLLNRLLFGGST